MNKRDFSSAQLDLVPDFKPVNFPRRATFAITREQHEKLEFLKSKSKDTPGFLRKVLNQALTEIFGPIDQHDEEKGNKCK